MLVHALLICLGYVLYSILCITSDNRNTTSIINPVSPLITQVVLMYINGLKYLYIKFPRCTDKSSCFHVHAQSTPVSFCLYCCNTRAYSKQKHKNLRYHSVKEKGLTGLSTAMEWWRVRLNAGSRPKHMTSCCFEVDKICHYSVPLNCN